MSERDMRAAVKIAEAAGILRLYGYDDEAQRIIEAAGNIAVDWSGSRPAGGADWHGHSEQPR